jgi:hypothetical protein
LINGKQPEIDVQPVSEVIEKVLEAAVDVVSQKIEGTKPVEEIQEVIERIPKKKLAKRSL